MFEGIGWRYLWAESTPWDRLGERNDTARHFYGDNADPLLTFLGRSGASPHQNWPPIRPFALSPRCRFGSVIAAVLDQLAG
jgi:hypothetical protein